MKKILRVLAPLLITSGLLAFPVPAHATPAFSLTWGLPSGLYAVGVDYLTATGGGGNYDLFYEYPYSVYNNNPVLPNPMVVNTSQNLSEVRIEWYSRHPGQGYDGRTGDGAVAMRLLPPFTSRNIGTVVFPQVGAAGTGRMQGAIRSRTPITAGRMSIDIFQTSGQRTTNTGVVLDAFSATLNSGSTYITGPLWTGRYLAFVTDHSTGAQAAGELTLSGDTTLDIDLDVVCFGLDECQWTGPTTNIAGKFHAVTPARIVDSRLGQGVPSIVKPGDGRNSDPNPNNRLASRLGHEFQVAGVGGVPATGVSAVLLNITVTNGATPGAMRLIPKPPRTAVFDDQSSYPAVNTQAPGVHWGTADTVASLQLVKVGVGGKIRVDNVSFGSVHLVVDVAGWVDESQPGQGGDRIVPLAPTRLLDTRIGNGGPKAPLAGGEQRQLKVAGLGGVPTDAGSVLGNLTSVDTLGPTFESVWPGGQAARIVSVLNPAVTEARSNLVCAGVGANGEWVLYNGVSTTALAFDVFGYTTSAAGSGGVVTALPSADLMFPTPLGPAHEFFVPVLGRGGVPASGVSAVWVVVTVQAPSTAGYVAVYPNSVTVPGTSNINWAAGRNVAALALVPLGIGGAIRLYHHIGTSSVSVSVVGWVS